VAETPAAVEAAVAEAAAAVEVAVVEATAALEVAVSGATAAIGTWDAATSPTGVLAAGAATTAVDFAVDG
jgi:hypothetical protein